MVRLSKISDNEYDEELIRKFYKNRIALKCLDCCANNKVEVNECELTSCSLHDIRPKFKVKKSENNNGLS